MEKNIRNIRAEFKKNGIFYTTTELAETLRQYVDFKPHEIYDPTCGQGNLLSVFDDDTPKYGQEIYEDELKKASDRLSNFRGYCGDVLKDDGFKGKRFDLIMANPPFSVKWEPNEVDERFAAAPCLPPPGKADYAFILHILWHLSDPGKAICLSFPGVLYRGQREGKIRQWLCESNYVERVVHIPEKTFTDTTIATCVMVLNKAKRTTDIIFEDRESHEERAVTLEEVRENGFCLSVSNYIQKEVVKEQIDPLALNVRARAQFLRRLKSELEFDREVCEMEGISITPFIRQIRDVLSVYEEGGGKLEVRDE